MLGFKTPENLILANKEIPHGKKKKRKKKKEEIRYVIYKESKLLKQETQELPGMNI